MHNTYGGNTPPSPTSLPETADADRPSGARAEFLWSFVYAWNGLVHAIRTQRNARVHAAIGAAAIVLGLVLRISPVEFAMVFVAITLVFIAEMFNTVAEACVDLVTTEYHPLAKIAKDVAAGAVLLNAILSVIIGMLVFGPHLLGIFTQAVGH
jgi:diacylglycerol kinase